MNIFVAKLNFSTEEESLRTLFEGYGEVESVKIIMDRETGRSKGYGFVEMANDDEGQNAIQDLNEQEFDGRTIVVKEAEDRRKNSNRGGGGGGYNRNRGGGGGGYDRNRGGGGGYNSRY